MPATPLYHPDDTLARHAGRIDKLSKREAASLASLKQLVRKQGLSLGLVRGPGEQNDVCLLRFLRSQGFDEKRVRKVGCNRSLASSLAEPGVHAVLRFGSLAP